MSKFKAGDKVVLEISAIEKYGAVPVAYKTTCGVRIHIKDLDRAELLKAEKTEKVEAKAEAKTAAKKTAKK